MASASTDYKKTICHNGLKLIWAKQRAKGPGYAFFLFFQRQYWLDSSFSSCGSEKEACDAEWFLVSFHWFFELTVLSTWQQKLLGLQRSESRNVAVVVFRSVATCVKKDRVHEVSVRSALYSCSQGYKTYGAAPWIVDSVTLLIFFDFMKQPPLEHLPQKRKTGRDLFARARWLQCQETDKAREMQLQIFAYDSGFWVANDYFQIEINKK